jgi:UDP-N-acetylmuramoyl-tripeptide--D-alanyl-D-alanine ligase
MFELGEAAHEEHQKIADKLAATDLSMVLLTGKEFSQCIVPSYFQVFESNEGLINYLENNIPLDYTILVKGSRGMKLENVIGKL